MPTQPTLFGFMVAIVLATFGCQPVREKSRAQVYENSSGGLRVRTEETSAHLIETRLVHLGKPEQVSRGSRWTMSLVAVEPGLQRARFCVTDALLKLRVEEWVRIGEAFAHFPELGRRGVVLRAVSATSATVDVNYSSDKFASPPTVHDNR
jgi:hypothetical protein